MRPALAIVAPNELGNDRQPLARRLVTVPCCHPCRRTHFSRAPSFSCAMSMAMASGAASRPSGMSDGMLKGTDGQLSGAAVAARPRAPKLVKLLAMRGGPMAPVKLAPSRPPVKLPGFMRPAAAALKLPFIISRPAELARRHSSWLHPET